MDGYKMTADTLRHFLERDNLSPEQKAEAEAKIRIYELLSDFTDADRYTAFDSSMFNEIYLGYITKVMDQIAAYDDDEVTQEAAKRLRNRVINKARSMLDSMDAKSAEAYYYES